MRRVAGDEHRVAIGRGARDVRGRGLAAGAGDVLDDDGPAERRVELLAENAGERIGGAAGGERHHEPDGRATDNPGPARTRGAARGAQAANCAIVLGTIFMRSSRCCRVLNPRSASIARRAVAATCGLPLPACRERVGARGRFRDSEPSRGRCYDARL